MFHLLNFYTYSSGTADSLSLPPSVVLEVVNDIDDSFVGKRKPLSTVFRPGPGSHETFWSLNPYLTYSMWLRVNLKGCVTRDYEYNILLRNFVSRRRKTNKNLSKVQCGLKEHSQSHWY